MSDDERSREPNTVPPPKGAKDMYSAPTRIGTLPEEVLAAMRTEASDATLAVRTSTMELAALERLKPVPPPPAPHAREAEEIAALPPTRAIAFALAEPSQYVRSLLVVAIALMLGALVAAALTLW